MDALEWLRKHLEVEGSDLLACDGPRVAGRLMAAEADALCNAGKGTPQRPNSRN